MGLSDSLGMATCLATVGEAGRSNVRTVFVDFKVATWMVSRKDLGRLLARRKMLVCLDDVWRVEDAKWFIFDNPTARFETPAESP